MSTDLDREAKPTLNLCKYGCEELWFFSGDGWSIPVYAFHMKDESDPREFALISAAVRLNGPQHAALKSAVERYTQSDEKWILFWSDLELVAKKCPGVRPTYYFTWKGEDQSGCEPRTVAIEVPKDTIDGSAAPAVEEFLKHVASTTSAIGYAQLKLVYSALCRQAFYWIYEKQKSVDMGFIKLHALPYRANWKEVMCSLYPKMSGVFGREDKELLLLQSGMQEQITAGNMVAIIRTANAVDWTVEVEHTKEWKRLIEESEKSRLSALGSVKYRKWWVQLVNRLRPKIWNLYELWIKKTTRPCANDSAVSRSGRDIFVPERKAGWLRPKAYRPCALTAVHNGETPKISNADRKRHNVVEAHEMLLPMPTVSAWTPNVWQSDWEEHGKSGGPKLGESSDKKDGTDGVPLLHAGQVTIEC